MEDILESAQDLKKGLRSLDGRTAKESQELLKTAIHFLEYKYKDGMQWIEGERDCPCYVNPVSKQLVSYYDMRPENLGKWKEVVKKEMVSEGPNDNYWLATAGNVCKALHNLLSLVELAPDGVWEIE